MTKNISPVALEASEVAMVMVPLVDAADAPEVTFSGPKVISSATLPPIAMAIFDLYLVFVTDN